MMEEWVKIENIPTWNPEREGDELIGYFVEVEKGVGANNSNLYTFKKEDGTLVKVWGSAILDQRFKNLEEGDKVKIIYRGKEKSIRTGRNYKNFEVLKAKKKEI